MFRQCAKVNLRLFFFSSTYFEWVWSSGSSPDVLIIRRRLIAWCYGRPDTLAQWTRLAWTFGPLRICKSNKCFFCIFGFMYICVFTSTGTIELIVYPGFYESNYGPDGNARHCRSGQNPTSPMSPGWVGVHRPVVLHIQDLLILFCGEPTCLYSVQCTLTIFIVRFLSPKFYSPLKPYK